MTPKTNLQGVQSRRIDSDRTPGNAPRQPAGGHAEGADVDRAIRLLQSLSPSDLFEVRAWVDETARGIIERALADEFARQNQP
jgi:hypothetical protein